MEVSYKKKNVENIFSSSWIIRHDFFYFLMMIFIIKGPQIVYAKHVFFIINFSFIFRNVDEKKDEMIFNVLFIISTHMIYFIYKNIEFINFRKTLPNAPILFRLRKCRNVLYFTENNYWLSSCRKNNILSFLFLRCWFLSLLVFQKLFVLVCSYVTKWCARMSYVYFRSGKYII